jgi:hypothetical protein
VLDGLQVGHEPVQRAALGFDLTGDLAMLLSPETVFGLSGEFMERAFWMAAGVALALMAGCADAEGLEVADVNARNAISKADAALSRVSDLEDRVAELESKAGM